MTADALTRLRAGLDRDEALARAAAERSAEWRSDGRGVEGGPFDPADPEWGIPWSGEHTIVYDEGWPKKSEAIHIAAFDPARVLRQAEKLRGAAAVLDDALNSDGPEPNWRVVSAVVLTLLAGVYTEDTAETGAQS